MDDIDRPLDLSRVLIAIVESFKALEALPENSLERYVGFVCHYYRWPGNFDALAVHEELKRLEALNLVEFDWQGEPYPTC